MRPSRFAPGRLVVVVLPDVVGFAFPGGERNRVEAVFQAGNRVRPARVGARATAEFVDELDRAYIGALHRRVRLRVPNGATDRPPVLEFSVDPTHRRAAADEDEVRIFRPRRAVVELPQVIEARYRPEFHHVDARLSFVDGVVTVGIGESATARVE